MTADRFEGEDAIIERDTYSHEGRRLVAWIIRPRGPGPFLVLVVNHGSGLIVQPDGTLSGTPERPTVDPTQAAWFEIARSGWLYLMPEGRGYGGSEGPDPRKAATSSAGTMEMLHGRARDANAAVDWVLNRPDAAASRVAITGGSHGGVVTLLAAATRPYAAAVPQAVGAAYGHTEFGAVDLANAAARIRAPVLFQHMRSDTLVPPEGARAIFDWSSRLRPQQRWLDYPGVPGKQGHFMYEVQNRAQWFPDYREFLHAAFAAPSPMLSPEDPAERLTEATLPFLLPPHLTGGKRWTGRFGRGPETLLLLDGTNAVYSWKDRGSRGYAAVPVLARGDALLIEPWPGTTVRYEPLPDNALRATFTQRGLDSVAILTPAQ